jgi:hypothetical protein
MELNEENNTNNTKQEHNNFSMHSYKSSTHESNYGEDIKTENRNNNNEIKENNNDKIPNFPNNFNKSSNNNLSKQNNYQVSIILYINLI